MIQLFKFKYDFDEELTKLDEEEEEIKSRLTEIELLKTKILLKNLVPELSEELKQFSVFNGDLNNSINTCEEKNIFTELYFIDEKQDPISFNLLKMKINYINNIHNTDADLEKFFQIQINKNIFQKLFDDKNQTILNSSFRYYIRIKESHFLNYFSNIETVINQLILLEYEKRDLRKVINNF